MFIIIMFTRSIEIDPTEGFLNSGNWPWLTVFSAGHALHVFVNGQLAGLMSFVTYNCGLSLFLFCCFISEVQAFDWLQLCPEWCKTKNWCPSQAARCYLTFPFIQTFCRNCVRKFRKPKTNFQQRYKSESWCEQDFSAKHCCWSSGLSSPTFPIFLYCRPYMYIHTQRTYFHSHT